ncbi:MAG: DUF554 domain-containing protein [Propionibacteriaceae bacterium]|nr:DUF554 domain-containing protein [Propionibacteriaceae bacterium]
MFVGSGTVINVATVIVGGLLGVLIGKRFPARTRELFTFTLGLFTIVIGGTSIASGFSAAFSTEVGSQAPFLIVLGSLLLGGLTGSLLRLEARLDSSAAWLQRKIAHKITGDLDTNTEQERFVEGMVSATLIFCVGPLAILGSISDGLGLGNQQLVVKAVMDGVIAISFASSFGIGVIASVIPLVIYQGSLTLLGFGLGEFLSAGQIDALTATGGVILLGLGIRIMGLKKAQIGDLVPALFYAPLLTWLVALAV